MDTNVKNLRFFWPYYRLHRSSTGQISELLRLRKERYSSFKQKWPDTEKTYFRTKGISTKSENPNLQAHAIIKLADNAWLPFKRQSSYDQFTFHYHRLKF